MNRQHAPWQIALGTFALALAVLVSGLSASPAQAKSGREVAVDKANALIDECFRNGGEPEVEVEENYGWVTVDCLYDDHQEFCFYYYSGTTSCQSMWIVIQPVGPWNQIGATDGMELMVEDSAASSVTDPAGSNSSVTDAADDQNQDQGKDNGKKNKKHKKGKKGGKGGRR
jgi:hypothetical protein